MEEELKLRIFKQNGVVSNEANNGFELMFWIVIGPITAISSWNELMHLTWTIQNILLISFIIASPIIAMRILYANLKLSKGKMLLTINKNGIGKEPWDKIVDLKITFTGKSSNISFDSVMGSSSFYHVELDKKDYEVLTNLKNKFFNPTKKVLKVFLPGEKDYDKVD